MNAGWEILIQIKLYMFVEINFYYALSITPILPDGNTSVPAQIIGLKAVRFIRNNPSTYVIEDFELMHFNMCQTLGLVKHILS